MIALLDACLVTGYGVKAAAGWSKPYSVTNRAVFKMGSGRLQAYLHVDEANATSPTEARILGYETTTGVDAATDPFPTTWYYLAKKSTTADATARPWKLVADDRTVILFTLPDPTQLLTASAIYFGEFYSYTPNDNFGVCVIGRSVENVHTWTCDAMPEYEGWNGSAIVLTAGQSLCRDGSGAVKGPGFSKTGGLGIVTDDNLSSNYALFYPNPDDGSIILTPIYIFATTAGNRSLRGRLRGIWAVPQAVPNGDTFSGTGSLSGRSFIHPGFLKKGTNYSLLQCLETSDTVERN